MNLDLKDLIIFRRKFFKINEVKLFKNNKKEEFFFSLNFIIFKNSIITKSKVQTIFLLF